jgi:hypothetical protein
MSNCIKKDLKLGDPASLNQTINPWNKIHIKRTRKKRRGQ